ncbi:hypothetical protein FC93_GL001866 [Lactobacillus kefiranofaciens subsp. kefiranofaciens DSM 5016 = JCM 6985]|nr:hypothetical protein FC93_GL001866 [Lactobacillus kefiranofaciens subsp. kefiranofaciens DSM 5016 = JCM 6985]
MNICDDLLTQQLLTFTKRPYTSWQLLMQQEKEVKIELKYTLMIHDDSLENLEHVDHHFLNDKLNRLVNGLWTCFEMIGFIMMIIPKT